MLTYRATITPKSATRTPWQADTLFGQLCWLIFYTEGEAALQEFLAHYQGGQPPLIFSNGCPADFLPRPLLPPRKLKTGQSKEAQIEEMQSAKAGKDVRWVSLEEFEKMRSGQKVVLTPRPKIEYGEAVLKNQINRLTFGTTPIDEDAGSGLYNTEELAFVDKSGVKPIGLDVSIYVKAADEQWANRAEELLRGLAKEGYGAKKSVGYGNFTLTGWEQFASFDEEPAGANGFISLSNWVPANSDPTDGFYNRLIKYGKLGEEFAASENPFKFPLVMLTAGSSFYSNGPAKDWYGRIVTDIAPARPEVVHYGFAFAVPAYLGKS